ncbi:MAG: GNAT family N-acetyltransferase [Saprospiraceae bacterium]
MKIFLSEYRHDYTTYTFGYTIYALFESTEDLNTLYQEGFLPYSGNISIPQNLYYKSRGLRVITDDFKDSSENRRVNRKVAELKIQSEVIPVGQFNEWDPFIEFANRYSNERIGELKMPLQRLKYITERTYLSHVIKFKSDEKIIGYILAIITDKIFHYWFSFYDTSFLEKGIPLGKWLMWKGIHIAKDYGCTHAYLGNGYLESALYKTRDFNAVEFYNGNAWSDDISDFQSRCTSDNSLKELDLFKLLPGQQEWLNNL